MPCHLNNGMTYILALFVQEYNLCYFCNDVIIQVIPFGSITGPVLIIFVNFTAQIQYERLKLPMMGPGLGKIAVNWKNIQGGKEKETKDKFDTPSQSVAIDNIASGILFELC